MNSAPSLVVLAFLFTACASEPQAPAADGSVAMRDPGLQDFAEQPVAADSAVAPIPFTAAQIREGCAPGTVLVQRIDMQGLPSMLQTTRFLKGDAERVTFESMTVTEDGTPAGERVEAETTWTELRDHARFPAELTTRSETTCEVVAGTYDCWLYTVDHSTAEKRQIDRLYFARELPGPPILFETEHDGTVVMRLELTELHRDG